VTLAQCAAKCDELDNCTAFEYGSPKAHSYGKCVPQSSSNHHGCNGALHGLDLYKKKTCKTVNCGDVRSFMHKGASEICGRSCIKDTCCEKTPIGYFKIQAGCVSGANIKKFTGKTLEECAAECDKLDECKAFEFGFPHNGKSTAYKFRDCLPQRSAKDHGCDGNIHNLDLYEKVPVGYLKLENRCVNGANIKKLTGKTLEECAAECNNNTKCKAFEFGFPHPGKQKTYKFRDCHPQSSSNEAGCKGDHHGLDLYKKSPPS